MTTSLDPSIDELLLLLQENEYPTSNLVFAKIKPIGAERKIGQTSARSVSQTKSSLQRNIDPMNIDYFTSRDIEQINNSSTSFDIASLPSSVKRSTMPIYDQFHCTSIDETILHERYKSLEAVAYHSSSSTSSSTSGSSTIHSLRSPSHHLLDNYNHQQQILSSSIVQEKLNRSMGKPLSSFRKSHVYSPSQFLIPNSSQTYSTNPFSNIYQQTRPITPVFTAPLPCTRERFQVNSIGRPILRTNNYIRLSQATNFKVRR